MRKVIMKEEYCGLEVEVLTFEAVDVIITSPDTESPIYPVNSSSGVSSFF